MVQRRDSPFKYPVVVATQDITKYLCYLKYCFLFFPHINIIACVASTSSFILIIISVLSGNAIAKERERMLDGHLKDVSVYLINVLIHSNVIERNSTQSE